MYDEQYHPDQTLKEMFLNIDGRLNRKRYLKRTLALLGLTLVASVLTGLLFSDGEEKLSFVGSVVLSAIIVCVYIVSYCLNVRRLHDLDLGNHLAVAIVVTGLVALAYEETFLAMILNLFNLTVGLFLMLQRGTVGKNSYGPDPLERT